MSIWKDIPNYEGKYKVSSNGEVKSIYRIIENKGTKSGFSTVNDKILKPCGTGKKRNYLAVNLSNNGKLKMFRVHRLVYISFIGDIPDGYCINHKDGDTTNNSIDNLECVTNRGNTNHYQNSNNRKTSKYIGVSLCKRTGKWFSCININGITKYLGRYKLEKEAYVAYLSAIKKYGIKCEYV